METSQTIQINICGRSPGVRTSTKLNYFSILCGSPCRVFRPFFSLVDRPFSWWYIRNIREIVVVIIFLLWNGVRLWLFLFDRVSLGGMVRIVI